MSEGVVRTETYLKEKFERNDYPSEDDFSDLIRTLFYRTTQSGVVGLKEYDPTQLYPSSTGCFFTGVLYQSNKTTTGEFKPADWNEIGEITSDEILLALGYTPVDAAGSYDNPGFVNSLAFSKLTGVPTTLAGHNITLTSGDVTTALCYTPVNAGGTYANPSFVTSLAFSKLTGVPTTLAGHNITLTSGDITTALGYTPVNAGGTYANPSFVTSLVFSKLTGLPTTLTGHNITLTSGDVTTALGYTPVNASGTYANPSFITSLAFSKITGLPNSQSGYGITDGWNIAGNTGSGNKIGTTSNNTWDSIANNKILVRFTGTTFTQDHWLAIGNNTGTVSYGNATTTAAITLSAGSTQTDASIQLSPKGAGCVWVNTASASMLRLTNTSATVNPDWNVWIGNSASGSHGLLNFGFAATIGAGFATAIQMGQSTPLGGTGVFVIPVSGVATFGSGGITRIAGTPPNGGAAIELSSTSNMGFSSGTYSVVRPRVSTAGIVISGGSANVDIFQINTTIDQGGAATGLITGIRIIPTLTSITGEFAGVYVNISAASNVSAIKLIGTAMSYFGGNISFAATAGLSDSNNNLALTFSATTSAIDYLRIKNGIGDTQIEAIGASTDVALTLISKGLAPVRSLSQFRIGAGANSGALFSIDVCTTSSAHASFKPGAAKTLGSRQVGDFWFDGDNAFLHTNSGTKTFTLV